MSDNIYKPIPASVLRNKGTCCKSGCVHCPYGHTLKKFGLEFIELTDSNKADLAIFEGFELNLSEYALSDYKYIKLKDFLCGVMRVDKLFVRELSLHKDFRDQGLDKPIIESYYFY